MQCPSNAYSAAKPLSLLFLIDLYVLAFTWFLTTLNATCSSIFLSEQWPSLTPQAPDLWPWLRLSDSSVSSISHPTCSLSTNPEVSLPRVAPGRGSSSLSLVNTYCCYLNSASWGTLCLLSDIFGFFPHFFCVILMQTKVINMRMLTHLQFLSKLFLLKL